MIQFPEMTVESRKPAHAWGVNPPLKDGDEGYNDQLIDMMELSRFEMSLGFPTEVIRILNKYNPLGERDYGKDLAQLGFFDWGQCCDFVRDDECIEFFVLLMRWCKKNKLAIKKNPEIEGFIDGQGFGLYGYFDNFIRKYMERGGDVKYFYQAERPLVVLARRMGFICPAMLNQGYIHPGHWSYTAWHAVKLYGAVVAASELYEMSHSIFDMLLNCAYVNSMGRSGIRVHLPQDNVASGYIFELDVFEKYGTPFAENEHFKKA